MKNVAFQWLVVSNYNLGFKENSYTQNWESCMDAITAGDFCLKTTYKD